MRTSNGVGYPDAVGYAFDVVLFTASNVERMMIEMSLGNDILATVEQDAFNGECYMDMRDYVQGIMSDVVSAAVSYASAAESGMSWRVFYSVYTKTGGQAYTRVVADAYPTFIWGALSKGESIDKARNLTWWRGYPFCIDYLSTGNAVTLSGGGSTDSITLPEGLGRIPLSGFSNASVVTLRRGNVTDTIGIVDCGEGVYLRWIDRKGMVCHWLFAKGIVSHEVSDDGEYRRNNLLSYDGQGWHGMNGTGGIKSRRKAMKVAALQVDADIRAMMMDMASSPVVEMYDEDADAWSAVRVSGGTWNESRAVLQDVEFDVVVDEIKLQRA